MTDFESKLNEETQNLRQQIAQCFGYFYTVFLTPSPVDDILPPSDNNLKNARIIPYRIHNGLYDFSSEPLIGLNQNSITRNKILEAQVRYAVENFYENIQISGLLREKLAEYGGRADRFIEQFEENMSVSKRNTTLEIIREIESGLRLNKEPRSIIRGIFSVIDKRAEALMKLLESSHGLLNLYMVLWEKQEEGFEQYKYLTRDEHCEDCGELNGRTFWIKDTEAGVNFPPLHPNCRCAVGVLDENGRVIETLELGGSGSGESSNWYDAFLRIPSDFIDLLKGLASGQDERFNNIKNPLDFLDWMTFGIISGGLSANRARGDIMLDDPSWYTVGNWLTSGLFDMINGTFNPDEPLSLEHWLNSLGTASLALASYKLVQKRLDAGLPENTIKQKVSVKAEAESADDLLEGAGNNKIPWDSWQNYEKVTQNGQTYAKVGDRLYSEHAVNRMQPSGNRFGPNIYQGLNGTDYGRSIAPRYVEDVISSTKPVFQPITGNYSHSLGNVEVIVNSKGAVVTILTYK